MQNIKHKFKIFFQKIGESLFLILIYFLIIGPTWLVLKVLRKQLIVKKPKRTGWQEFSGSANWTKMY